MNKIIAIFLVAQFALSVDAATWTNGTIIVKHVIWKPSYNGFYSTASTYHDPENCGGTSNLYVIDSAIDEKEKDRLLSIILTASTTGKPLHLWVDGCQGGLPKFSGIQLNL